MVLLLEPNRLGGAMGPTHYIAVVVAFAGLSFGGAVSFAQSSLVEDKNIVVQAYPSSPVDRDISGTLNLLRHSQELNSTDRFIDALKPLVKAGIEQDRNRLGQPPPADSELKFCSKPDQAYIFHVALWHVNEDSTYSLSFE